MTLAEAAAQADALAEEGKERELADLRREWEDEVEGDARSADYRERAVAYRAVGQFRFRQKMELLGAGSRTRARPAAGRRSSRSSCSRATRRCGERCAPLLHRLASADDNQAVRRLAVVWLRNGSAQPRHDRAARRARRGRRATRPARDVAAQGRGGAEEEGGPACSLGLAAPGVRVRLEVRLAAALVGDVRVQLGRGEVGVAEHLLDAA